MALDRYGFPVSTSNRFGDLIMTFLISVFSHKKRNRNTHPQRAVRIKWKQKTEVKISVPEISQILSEGDDWSTITIITTWALVLLKYSCNSRVKILKKNQTTENQSQLVLKLLNLALWESKDLCGINISNLDRFPEVLSASFYNGSSQTWVGIRIIWGLVKHRQLGCSPRVWLSRYGMKCKKI